MGVGYNIKQILKEKKMTIRELSEETGIPVNTLYAITKKDSFNVRRENLTKISNVLNVPIEELFAEKNEQKLRQGNDDETDIVRRFWGAAVKMLNDYKERYPNEDILANRAKFSAYIYGNLKGIFKTTGNSQTDDEILNAFHEHITAFLLDLEDRRRNGNHAKKNADLE